MDDIPDVEGALDSFSVLLPLPFRIGAIVVAGAWAWGANLHYLSILKIDVPALLRYPPRSSSRDPAHHFSTYRFASLLSVPFAVSLTLFWLLTRGQPSLVLQWQIIPNFYLICLVLSFFTPNRLARAGRSRFLQIMRRISLGGIAKQGDGRFADIIAADVLTSYAKVLGDMFVTLCMVFTRQYSTARPDRDCGGVFMVPFLIAVPSLIRFRQCIIEFLRVRASTAAGGDEHGGWGGSHLANALKYASALPVIVLSAFQREFDPSTWGLSDTILFRSWLFFVFLNSFYSFWWDVAKDWDLTLLSPSTWNIRVGAATFRYHHVQGSSASNPQNNSESGAQNKQLSSQSYPYGLRRHMHFHTPSIYYTAIFIDLLLRCTWSFKLSPHLDHFNDLEGGIFVLELLEVFRRWVWIFFRIEAEWVRSLKGRDVDMELEATNGLLSLDFSNANGRTVDKWEEE